MQAPTYLPARLSEHDAPGSPPYERLLSLLGIPAAPLKGPSLPLFLRHLPPFGFRNSTRADSQEDTFTLNPDGDTGRH